MPFLRPRIRPWLPLLLLHVALMGLFATNELANDGPRYVQGATRWLTTGQLADPVQVDIRNGPAYPATLLPLVAIGATPWAMKACNLLLLWGGLFYLYTLLQIQVSRRLALMATYALGLYPPLLAEVVQVAYEPLLILAMGGFLYHLFQAMQTARWHPHTWVAACYATTLAHTKPNVAYVLVALLLTSVAWGWARREASKWQPLCIFGLACLLMLPYLSYTYSLTGRVFFWGNQGGELMYWKTAPYVDEYGTWFQAAEVVALSNASPDTWGQKRPLVERHATFLKEMLTLPPLARDSAFMAKAKTQLATHPEAYLKNSAASLLRLWFNYPFSYDPQTLNTYFHLLPNLLLIGLLVPALWSLMLRAKQAPMALWIAIVWAMLYLGSIVLLNGRVRHLIPTVPIWLWLIVYTFDHWLIIRVRK